MHASALATAMNLICSCNSIAHEYKEWKEQDTQLVTCTKNIIQSGTPPQEVEADKEIVFTYDVTFEVCYSLGIDDKILNNPLGWRNMSIKWHSRKYNEQLYNLKFAICGLFDTLKK